jgi:hypothetical protein
MPHRVRTVVAGDLVIGTVDRPWNHEESSYHKCDKNTTERPHCLPLSIRVRPERVRPERFVTFIRGLKVGFLPTNRYFSVFFVRSARPFGGFGG